MIEDLAKRAETVIAALKRDPHGRIGMKTNQIRKFLAAVNALTNRIRLYRARHPEAAVLPEPLAEEVKYLKVKIAYQAGRDRYGYVKDFVERAQLVEAIDAIGCDYDAYLRFARYMEALVAYHRFLGGREG